jgi:hypothetical protein
MMWAGTDLEILQIAEHGPIIQYKVHPVPCHVERGTVCRGESDSGGIHNFSVHWYTGQCFRTLWSSLYYCVCVCVCVCISVCATHDDIQTLSISSENTTIQSCNIANAMEHAINYIKTNNTVSVRVTQRWGAFVKPLLLKSNNHYIFWVLYLEP